MAEWLPKNVCFSILWSGVSNPKNFRRGSFLTLLHKPIEISDLMTLD